MEERPFTLEESELMKRLVTALMIHAPYIQPRSLFLSLDEMVFVWKKMEKNNRIEHPIWLVKTVYVRIPDHDDDNIKEHIIRMVPHLVRQLYEQMDYKEHQFTHTLNHILYKDRLGKYREQYRKSISFYKTLLNAYRAVRDYAKGHKGDLQQQYQLRKELTMKYGKGFELALEIYMQYHI